MNKEMEEGKNEMDKVSSAKQEELKNKNKGIDN